MSKTLRALTEGDKKPAGERIVEFLASARRPVRDPSDRRRTDYALWGGTQGQRRRDDRDGPCGVNDYLQAAVSPRRASDVGRTSKI